MLMTQSRTRQNGGSQPWFTNVDGDSRRDQFAIAGFECKRSIQAGPQVQTGRAGCGILGERQFASDALIQNLDFDLVSQGIGGYSISFDLCHSVVPEVQSTVVPA